MASETTQPPVPATPPVPNPNAWIGISSAGNHMTNTMRHYTSHRPTLPLPINTMSTSTQLYATAIGTVTLMIRKKNKRPGTLTLENVLYVDGLPTSLISFNRLIESSGPGSRLDPETHVLSGAGGKHVAFFPASTATSGLPALRLGINEPDKLWSQEIMQQYSQTAPPAPALMAWPAYESVLETATTNAEVLATLTRARELSAHGHLNTELPEVKQLFAQKIEGLRFTEFAGCMFHVFSPPGSRAREMKAVTLQQLEEYGMLEFVHLVNGAYKEEGATTSDDKGVGDDGNDGNGNVDDSSNSGAPRADTPLSTNEAPGASQSVPPSHRPTRPQRTYSVPAIPTHLTATNTVPFRPLTPSTAPQAPQAPTTVTNTPSAEEIKAAIPAQGITMDDLVALFNDRLSKYVHREFIDNIQRVGKYDMATKRVFLRD